MSWNWCLLLYTKIICHSYFLLHGILKRKGRGWSGAGWVNNTSKRTRKTPSVKNVIVTSFTLLLTFDLFQKQNIWDSESLLTTSAIWYFQQASPLYMAWTKISHHLSLRLHGFNKSKSPTWFSHKQATKHYLMCLLDNLWGAMFWQWLVIISQGLFIVLHLQVGIANPGVGSGNHKTVKNEILQSTWLECMSDLNHFFFISSLQVFCLNQYRIRRKNIFGIRSPQL